MPSPTSGSAGTAVNDCRRSLILISSNVAIMPLAKA